MGNQPGKERRDYGRKIDWTNAERPSPPGKPYLVPEEGDRRTDVITIRWSPPVTDGGAPIKGYVVEHRRTGSPHWLRAVPNLVLYTELPLTGLEPGWRYQFRVSAENEIGRSEPGELSEPLTVTPQKWAASAPFFNVELQDTIGLENEKVEFKVQVIAIPPPTISWYKDGFEIFSSRRTKIVTENDQSTFIIHQAALEDEGEIKCTATNRAGHAVTKANLRLEAPPRIRLPRQYEDGLIFERGELIRLKVTTAGRPKPHVLWYHDGELLQKGGRIDISDSETGSIVRISDACREDRGEYVIRGANKIGEDVASFLVTVTDRPSPPGKIQVTTLGRKVLLSWSSPEDDGGCKIGSYLVEYFRIGWDMWLKARNCRQLSTTLEELIEGSEYKFRVRAENPYGLSDPSEESDVIFITDPKRGILKPPVRKETPEILKESKISQENEMDKKPIREEDKRRMLLEEKARKLLDTPLSVLLPYENTKPGKRKTESSSESVTFASGSENTPPPVPKRRNKGKRSTPSPVDMSPPDRSTSTPMDVDKSRLTPSPVTMGSPKTGFTFPTKPKEALNGTMFSEDRKKGDSSPGNLSPFEREFPMFPRENDDSILHGSSELMLVIYPRDRSKSVELNAQQRLEIEMNLTADGVAPPMSLSAPELGSNEPIDLPPMRDAVSSTELLYEKTMARLYQDAIDEEAQRKVKRRYSMDRKSVERRSSLKESLLERRFSFKEDPKSSQQQTSVEKTSKIPVQKTNKPAEEFRSLIPIPENNKRLNSVEREQLEFAMVRERLKKKEEEKGTVANHQQQSDTTTTTTSSSAELDEEEDYGDDEYIEEEEEEDYLDEKKKDKPEEEDLDFDDDTLPRKEFSTKIPVIDRVTSQNRTPPRAEQEEDTYHPRSMIPTRSILSKVEKPDTLKPEPPKISISPPSSPSLQRPEAETKTEKTPKIPILSPTKTKKTSKLLKKFGLKKEKKVPEVLLTPADPNLPPPVIPKPILKNKIPSKKKDSPKTGLKLSLSKTSVKSVSEEESESEFPGGKKKKQVRIAEPNQEEALSKKKEKPVDENARENQVLIYHYSDIVKEFGSNKKPVTKLYLNYDELKAHAKPEESTTVKQTNPTPRQVKPDGIVRESIKQPETGQKEEEPKTKARQQETRFNWSTEYVTDVVLFVIACWLYLFKNEIYVIPILGVMAYRQLKDMTLEKYAKIKNSISKRIPERLKGKTGNGSQ